MAQKRVTYLNISVMMSCVMRNGWLSFAHTYFSSQHCGTHAVSSGYFSLTPCATHTQHTICYIYLIKLYTFICLPKFYRKKCLGGSIDGDRQQQDDDRPTSAGLQ